MLWWVVDVAWWEWGGRLVPREGWVGGGTRARGGESRGLLAARVEEGNDRVDVVGVEGRRLVGPGTAVVAVAPDVEAATGLVAEAQAL